ATPTNIATSTQTIEPTLTPTSTPTQPSGGSTATSTPSIIPLQVPSQPVLTAPQPDEIIVDPSPALVWMANPVWENVHVYKLVVRDLAGQIAYRARIPSQQCAAGSCVHDLAVSGTTLANGTYTWIVKAKNAVGKTKSPKQSFTIEFPGKATLYNPES